MRDANPQEAKKNVVFSIYLTLKNFDLMVNYLAKRLMEVIR